MFLRVSKALAQDIVNSMKEIIKQDINYFDKNGIVIASTDIDRIGSFHGGARTVLETNSGLVIDFDGQYQGAKKGINLPVYFENKIIGVIGITGDKDEVGKFGKIIQRMTEILVKEEYIKEQDRLERKSKKQFIEEILFRMYKEEDKKTLKMRADLLNIKINCSRVVVVSRISNAKDNETIVDPIIRERIYNFIRSYTDFNPQNIMVQSGMNYLLILDTSTIKDINSFITNIYNNIKTKYEIEICFGIGDSSTNVDEMRRSYLEAVKALNVALSLKINSIVAYSSLDIELLLDDVPKESIEKFLKKVFNSMNSTQIESYMGIVKTYIENNCSINQTADKLFIHKNTLQYKLNKLKTITGYDPKNIDDMVVLYLAIMLKAN